jgi:hypothetical protein
LYLESKRLHRDLHQGTAIVDRQALQKRGSYCGSPHEATPARGMLPHASFAVPGSERR